ncbi:MAG: chromosome segregation protein SMC [Acidobacteria bacterium]|nr:chromosome segregation protein SMC [Acidobacteriota bacterium]
MFKLQRLEITGFKSFADYTELVFTGSGITAIVGPNGCGKSNVADAIAWVLGEQRARSLRGGEMKDVIFQGSRNRQPSGMAEVVLHMVRDETTEEEPDIEDIDSTLEELDEQAEAIEEKLSPEVAGAEDAAPLSDATAVVSSPSDTPNALAPSNMSIASTDAGPSHLAQTNGDGEQSLLTGAETLSVEVPVSEQASVAGQPETDAAEFSGGEVTQSKTRAAHKRHWRPRRMALGFAPGETVAVTRRLYRSGESEYLLNGRICRLRDIQDLFSGTGLSGAHYAIIEQGRIGQILSAKPMDRRTLIEEAAGITKFRVRQRAAEARLDGARTNLHRVSDIISEIEKQVNSLRRQAAKARRYRQVRDELRELLRQVYAADERALTTQLDDLRARLVEANEEADVFAGELESREESARQATAEARRREEELAGARAAVSEAALRSDRRERERTYQEDQIAALEKRLAEVRQETDMVRARLAAVEAESETLLLTDVQLREANDETARQLEAAENSYAQRVAEVLEAEAAIETARAALLTHTAVAERLLEIGRQLEVALEKLAAQAEGLAHEGERAAAAHAQARGEQEQLLAEIAVARARIDALLAEREGAARSLADAREVVAHATVEHARVRDDAARVRHRLDTLAELDAQRALYSQAVQRIFSAEGGGGTSSSAPKDFHFIGTLADVLRVEPRWERAVESVFGPYLQSVIVPTPDDAVRAAAWLQAMGAGHATFLVAGLHGGADDADTSSPDDSRSPHSLTEGDGHADAEEGVLVASLLGAPREIANVLSRTLTREMNARVAADLDQATMRSLATGRMYVTPRGEWVAGGQLVGAGVPKGSEEGTGLLAFKREMRELETRAIEFAEELGFAEAQASAARTRLGELEDAYVFLNDAIGREEREHVGRELNAAQIAQEIERAERHMRVVSDDAARLAAEQKELQERRAAQIVDAEAAEAARLAATQEVALAAEMLAGARRVAESESEHLSRQRALAAAAAERRRATTAELRRMEAESGDLHARLERHDLEIEEMHARLEQLRRSLVEMDESAGLVESERASLEREVEQASSRLAEAREGADALSLELTELHQRAAAARDARAATEVLKAETAARLNYVRESCMNELNQSLEEVANETPQEDGFDLEASRARLEELRARVEAFGAVNMMALEELAESEERFGFLSTQRQDILDGISSTEEALREIKRRSRERFRHAFEEVNRNFSQFFVELFGGGRGEMSLIDGDDVLESGIDIVAQPPGKRLQSVLLLSGGEKAMAALALVLAIFKYRPSPFCLLDEVDAPLDEANISRFTAKIMEMSAETQFLVVTHNKRTMEVGRALYGVTMEEVGVSKLVSVRFE